MKKNRPGVSLSVLCRPVDADALEAALFRETTTLGVRRSILSRRTLRREVQTVATAWGPVAGVLAWGDDGTARFSPEFEACRQIAESQNVPLGDVYQAARQAFQASSQAGRGAGG